MVEERKDGLVERLARAIDPLTWDDRDIYVQVMVDQRSCSPEVVREVAAKRVRHSLATATRIFDTEFATLQAERDRYRVAAIRAALCLSGYIGEGIFVEDHEYPEDVYDNICVALGSPNADDDELRTALSDTPTVQS